MPIFVDPQTRGVISQFKNEFNNDIIVSAEDVLADNTDQIKICLVGPNSKTENIITEDEARELMLVLAARFGCKITF